MRGRILLSALPRSRRVVVLIVERSPDALHSKAGLLDTLKALHIWYTTKIMNGWRELEI
jgi:hypothetical protein